MGLVEWSQGKAAIEGDAEISALPMWMHVQGCIPGSWSQQRNIGRIEIAQGDHDRADQVAQTHSFQSDRIVKAYEGDRDPRG